MSDHVTTDPDLHLLAVKVRALCRDHIGNVEVREGRSTPEQ